MKNDSPFIFQVLRRNVPIVVFLVLALAGMIAVYWYFNPDPASVEAVTGAVVAESSDIIDPNAPLAPILKPVKPIPVTQRTQQSPPPLRIGLIAGHRGNDSGTECEDGLTEVEVTSDLIEKLAVVLRESGIRVDSLDEFDPRLKNYFATALMSVHVDSCDYVNDLATGFKISGSPYTDSSQLSICVQQAYAEATNLPYHPNSITPHMANYHAFREISPGTPALIIEVGFLHLDRNRLVNDSEDVVNGLANGILCYLEEVR
jgi:N-acetylmuramoyl-L-alanine amidase